MMGRDIRLGVNIDHVATLRQARKAQAPDPVHAAVLAELGGADAITVHIRQDRRHIQDRDIRLLRETVGTRLNVEMAVGREVLDLILDINPQQVTLVPERPDELTTEGGLDVAADITTVARCVSALKETGIHVSIFVDPVERQISAAREAGCDAIEICTARYADRPDADALDAVRDAAIRAQAIGIAVHAGHGLDYQSVIPVAELPQITELNIGHAIIARAVLVGIERAVREMKETIDKARRNAG